MSVGEHWCSYWMDTAGVDALQPVLSAAGESGIMSSKQKKQNHPPIRAVCRALPPHTVWAAVWLQEGKEEPLG